MVLFILQPVFQSLAARDEEKEEFLHFAQTLP